MADSGDEKDLLRKLMAGDERAYEALVRSTGPKLLATARRIVRNDHEAQEVVQETFAQAFEKLDSFEGRSKLTTWLTRIAINFALQRLRDRQRDLSNADESVEELEPQFDEWGCRVGPSRPVLPDPERRAVARQELRLLAEALEALPADHRSLLVMSDLEGLSGAEVSEILGISSGATRVRLHRARAALRAMFDRKRRTDGEETR